MLAATPSRSGDSHIAAITSPRSDDAHSTVSQKVQNLIEEVLSWQKRNKTQDIPPKHGDDSEARNLGMRFAKLLLRREKALGAKPSEVRLRQPRRARGSEEEPTGGGGED